MIMLSKVESNFFRIFHENEDLYGYIFGSVRFGKVRKTVCIVRCTCLQAYMVIDYYKINYQLS